LAIVSPERVRHLELAVEDEVERVDAGAHLDQDGAGIEVNAFPVLASHSTSPSLKVLKMNRTFRTAPSLAALQAKSTWPGLALFQP
jgi:hypothetical protein